MRKAITALAVLALGLGVIGTAAAASDTTSHDVTIAVPTIDLIAVSGTPGTLTIAEPTALSDPGGEPMYSNEDTSCTLLWLTNGTGRKVTAELDVGLPTGLKLLATVTPTAGKGTSQGEVELSDSPQEVVTGINRKWEWNATISYKASATEEAEPTTETVTVTYTITN
jgi:hypothetical protein